MALSSIPAACAISFCGGTSVSASDGASAQGVFVANNNGGACTASSNGFLNEFKDARAIDFNGGGTINSELALQNGNIGIYSETTKLTNLGSETSTSLVAEGSTVDVALLGQKDCRVTGQGASVKNGIVSSSLDLAIGDSLSAHQNTALMGDDGVLGSLANSKTNNMVINGGFSGCGDIRTDLTAIASDNAIVDGKISFNDQDVINEDILRSVADGKLSIAVAGIYDTHKGGLGEFGVTANKALTRSQNNIDFLVGGWIWGAPIHYKLSTNSIGSSTSANAKMWAQEISKGCNQWDTNTAKNVFRGSDTTNTPGSSNVVEFTNNKPTVGKYQGGTGDGNNNYMEATTGVTGSTIAVTYTWYYSEVYLTGQDGKTYHKAAESDTYFNANKYWRVASAPSTATNSKFDVRTITTHEVGHALGLLDLYESADKNKIMYGYNNGEVKWYLSNADKLGLWSLYGQ